MAGQTDVAALAAALDQHWLDRVTERSFACTCNEWSVTDAELRPDGTYQPFNDHVAEAIIAALAAQGWRMASDPVFWDERAHEVSAQAAPGFATGGNDDAPSTRAQAAPGLQRAWQHWLDEQRRIEQAAVRAALEGLRAEVAVLTSYKDPHGGPRLQARVLAAIDARLAALP